MVHWEKLINNGFKLPTNRRNRWIEALNEQTTRRRAWSCSRFGVKMTLTHLLQSQAGVRSHMVRITSETQSQWSELVTNSRMTLESLRSWDRLLRFTPESKWSRSQVKKMLGRWSHIFGWYLLRILKFFLFSSRIKKKILSPESRRSRSQHFQNDLGIQAKFLGDSTFLQ